MTPEERFRGCLLGLAVGDAVGTTNEFSQSPPPLDDMVGGGPFKLAPGEWTDDTSMALCLADSLIACGGFDALDQMQRYQAWRQDGLNSVTGSCFDIGITISGALDRFVRTGNPEAGDPSPNTAGNGSLMRLAPVPLFYWRHDEQAAENAARSSRTTHAAPQAVDACIDYTRLILRALRGGSKDEIFRTPGNDLDPAIAAVAASGHEDKKAAQLRPTGYVVDSLEAALCCFAVTGNFRDGCLMAANLGGDADTIAAIYGQLAGAFYGESGIPDAWLSRLAWRERIAERADALYRLSPNEKKRWAPEGPTASHSV